MEVAVIGGGAYGSYVINALLEKHPDIKITLFEVGDKNIGDENKIGYKTNILRANYTGLAKGRFFGFGGATAKWGGQLLTFSKNDFRNPGGFLKDIVAINEKYSGIVFSRFGIKNPYGEPFISDTLFIKTGFWLSYFKRNLFYYFKINKKSGLRIIENARVTKTISDDKKFISKIIYQQNGISKEASFDFYFLTAGAFESHRILLNSGLIDDTKISFSDHLSKKVFKINGDTKIGNEDFCFRVNGASLITKRIIGEIDGISFFVNPIFNSEFPFFQNLKKVLFKREISFSIIKEIILDLPGCLAFVWYLLIKRKIFVYKRQWLLYIDVENPKTNSFICLSDDKDKFNEKALNVSFTIDKDVQKIYEQVKFEIKELLISNNINFDECESEIDVEKCEDTYHPYGMYCNFKSSDDYYKSFQNMLILNTGILPRAGGINSTAAVFPLIEEFIEYYFPYKK